MSCKDGCIIINCCGDGESKTGTSPELEVLFSGNADTMNATYDLAGDVTEYTCLIVEVTLSQDKVSRDYVTIPFPQVTGTDVQYARLMTAFMKNGTFERGRIIWCFNKGNQLQVTGIIKVSDGNATGPNELAITKIYGIR